MYPFDRYVFNKFGCMKAVLSPTERLILAAPGAKRFPIIQAALAALRSCGKCGHKGLAVDTLLGLAATKYCTDKDFIAFVRNATGLPYVMFHGIRIG